MARNNMALNMCIEQALINKIRVIDARLLNDTDMSTRAFTVLLTERGDLQVQLEEVQQRLAEDAVVIPLDRDAPTYPTHDVKEA